MDLIAVCAPLAFALILGGIITIVIAVVRANRPPSPSPTHAPPPPPLHSTPPAAAAPASLATLAPSVEEVAQGAPDVAQRDALATMRQLRRWQLAGQIDDGTHARLVQLARQSLLEASPPPSPAESRVAAAPIAPQTVAVGSEIVEAVVVASPTPTPTPAKPAFPLHPLDRPDELERPREPSAPRRALADVLQAFMEERNIRWGEIISGVLIVVSAVGLVVSLRATLRNTIPYFPALLFLGVTGGIHLAGHYSLRRWNLRSTSRGVLVIGTLLIPLNFLASILLSGSGESQRAATDPWFLAALVIGAGAFSFMVWKASAALLSYGRWRWLVALIGPSLSQIAVHRLAPESPTLASSLALLALPAFCLLIPAWHALYLGRRRRRATTRFAQRLLFDLSLAAYAALVPLGILIARAADRREALACAAPFVSLLGGVLLAHGVLLYRRWTEPRHALLRTIGMALVVQGVLGLFLALGFAWPTPLILIGLCLLNFVLLSTLAVGSDAAVLYAAGGGSLLLAAFVEQLRERDPLAGSRDEIGRRLIDLAFTSTSTYTLLAAFVAASLVALAASRLRRPALRDGYAIIALATFASATAITSIVGFVRGPAAGGDDAAWLFALLASLVAVVSFTQRRSAATIVACLLLGAMLLHGGLFHSTLREQLAVRLTHPWVALTTAWAFAASIYAIIAALVGWHTVREWSSGRCFAWSLPLHRLAEPGKWWPDVVLPAARIAQVVSVAALAGVVWHMRDDYTAAACAASSLVLVWLVAARLEGRTAWLNSAQILSGFAVILAAIAWASRQPWWTGYVVDLRFAPWLLIALAAWSVVCGELRRAAATWGRRFPTPPWKCEAYAPAALAVGLLALSVAAAWPSLIAEWSGDLGVADFARRLPLAAPDRLDLRAMWGAAAAVVVAVRVCLPKWSRTAAWNSLWLATLAAPPLLAASFLQQQAGATTLRWASAAWTIGWLCIVSLPSGARPWIVRWLAGPLDDDESPSQADSDASRTGDDAECDASLLGAVRDATLAMGLLAVLGLTTYDVLRLASGRTPEGPAVESLFKQMGVAWSYGAPLAAIALACLAAAMRFQLPRWALAGNLTTCYLAALVSLIPPLLSGRSFDDSVLLTLLYWLVAAQAAYGVVWRMAFARIEPDDHSGAWRTHWWLFHVSVVLQTLRLVVFVFLDHQAASRSLLPTIASPLAAVSALLAGAYWVATLVRPPCGRSVCGMTRIDGLIAWNLAAIPILAVAVDVLRWRFDANAPPIAWHVLEVGWLAVALLAAFRPATPFRAEATGVYRAFAGPLGLGTRLWGLLLGGALILIALSQRDARRDHPAQTIAVLAGLQALATVLAVRERRRLFAFLSFLLPWLIAFAGIQWIWPSPRFQAPADLPAFVLTCMTAWSSLWLVIESHLQTRGEVGLCPTPVRLRPHRFGAWFTVVAATLVFGGLWIGRTLDGRVLNPSLVVRWSAPSVLVWILVAALVTHLLATLWDRRSRTALFLLYLAGVPLGSLLVDALGLDFGHSVLVFAWLISLQALAASYLWNRGIRVALAAERLGIAAPLEGLQRTALWLPLTNLLVFATTIFVAFALVLERDERSARTLAALLPLCAAFGAAFLVQKERRTWAPHAALFAAACAGILMSWADLPPGLDHEQWLRRAMRALMGLVGFTFVYAVVARRLVRWPAVWIDALRSTGRTLAAASILALLVVLALEAAAYQRGVSAAMASNLEVVAVALTLVGLAVGLIALALWPDRPAGADSEPTVAAPSADEPLTDWLARATGAANRSELVRMACVYGAQFVVALSFAHLYLTRPQWFEGELRYYWPYIVLAIAFGGVAIGELVQRWGGRVLSEPLQRTGMLLPLVPALGWWIAGSRTDYSLLLFLIGLLYVATSVLRRSWWSRLAAAVAGNGAIWALLQKWDGFSIADHPQLWLVPPAASVIAAVHWNRRQLSPAQAASLRYASMAVIYLSSASELFITGIGESLWPPLILLSLSLAGMLLGMALRVRAFLFLGAIFVLLSLVSMVWHASRSIEHVWPWWAFGICSGLLILTFFGLFEKKRPELMALVERLRAWEK
ncbi:MAG: hypothetical protein U0939_01450 [Pirellulales bacterium]